MAEHRKFIRQAPADAEEYIGLEGEIIVETDTFLIRVHDGITPGGYATLTLASALAQFVTLTDFNAAIAQVVIDVTEINDAALETIIGTIVIQKGPVEDIVTGPPGSPATGDRFLIASGGTSGIFIGKENQVVEYIDPSTPIFSGVPSEGNFVYVQDENKVYYYTTSWGLTNPDVTYSDRQTAIDAAIALKANIESPTFTGVPAAPTAAPGTDTTQLATTAFVNAAVGGGVDGLEFDNQLTTSGYQKLPGGLILQWVQGVDEADDVTQNTQTVAFPISFPTACLHVQVTARILTASALIDLWYQLVGTPTTASCDVQRQHSSGGTLSGIVTRPFVFAIGH